MEQNGESRNKPTTLWLINIWEEASTYNGLKIVYSINGVSKIGQTPAEK